MARPPFFARSSSLLAGLFALALGPSAAAAPPPPTAGAPTNDAAAVEKLRRGVVQVEQSGRPMAVGIVLSKDGRVVTSLSALGAAEAVEVRYADNTVVKAKVGHKDPTWDLALLIPQSGRWLEGLMPTDADPSGQDVRAFLPKGGKLGLSGLAVKGRTDARAKAGDPLHGALDVDLKGAQTVPGAPLIDHDGKVVGILVRACKETGAAEGANGGEGKPAPCAPLTIAVPVQALRGFLMKTPTTAVQPAPWLGLGGAPTDAGNVRGIRVMGVAPGSPAEKAGLKAGGDSPDTIVAVDGQPVETPEQLAQVLATRAIGQSIKLLVFSQGKFREAAVTLRAAPATPPVPAPAPALSPP